MATQTRTPRTRRKTGLLLAGGTAVVSGFAVFINGYGVRAFREVADPATYTTLKNAFAAVLLIAVMLVMNRNRSVESSQPLARKHWVWIGFVAVFGGA
ncbi:MAG: hypothetical protein ACR2N7_00345, partial [Acidimicrobiia bacterium]